MRLTLGCLIVALHVYAGSLCSAQLFTPGGCLVEVISPEYHTDQQVLDGTAEFLYNTGLVATIASEYNGPYYMYNCHGYALYMVSEGGPATWINKKAPYYETHICDPSFDWTSDTSTPGVVVDYTKEHSGVVIGTNKVRSKWGELALLDHAPNQVPTWEYGTVAGYYCPCGGDNTVGAETSLLITSCTNIHADIHDPWESSEYVFEGSNDLAFWQPQVTVARDPAGPYNVIVPECMTYLRVVGLSASGKKEVVWIGTTSDGSGGGRIAADERSSSAAQGYVRESLKEREPVGRSGTTIDKTLNPGVLILYPSLGTGWASYSDTLAGIYSSLLGLNTRVVACPPGVTPADAAATQEMILQEIQASYEDFKYVHLVGDASDWEYFGSGGPHTFEFWTDEWAARRDNLINTYGYIAAGQPSQNLLPTFVVADNDLVRGLGGHYITMSALYPYYLTDCPYADVDADGLPDVSIGRWPIDTLEEYGTMLNKLRAYIHEKLSSNGRFRISTYLGDVDRIPGSDNGSKAAVIHDTVLAETGASQFRNDFVETDWLGGGGGNRLAATVGAWNGGAPDICVMTSTRSGRLDPAAMFNAFPTANWEAEFHLTGLPALMIATECGTADFGSTEQLVAGAVQHPIVERFLFESGLAGAIAWIGPTVGSWLDSNGIIAQRIVRKVYEDPDRPMAESYRLAIRELLVEYAGDDMVVKLARSYAFLGDPVSGLRRNEQYCNMSAANLNVAELFEPCGAVEITWQTPEVIACDYRVSLVGGTVLDAGTTEPGASHQVTWYGERGVSYRVEVTPQCSGATTISDRWRVKICGSERMEKSGKMEVHSDPASAGAVVTFSLATEEDVRVSVYDIRGRLVATVEEGRLPAGHHSVSWKGSDWSGKRVATGVYLVSVTIGVDSTVEKVLVLK